MAPSISHNKLLIVFLALLLPGLNISQEVQNPSVLPDSLRKVVLMHPTGEMVRGLPEMSLLADTTLSYQKVMAQIKNSFAGEFLDVYFLAQVYLKNKNKLKRIEPAYIALTSNQGGFAKFGFSLRDRDNHLFLPNTAYVDITESQATSPADKLMSFTQLYPHEMGHVLFRMLSREDSVNNNANSVNMHFFSIVTDYATAFNEGFAEHIENVSRKFEPNLKIKNGIYEDINNIGKSMGPFLTGFKRDYMWPVRLGYYKASMLYWYQKFEDYKRHMRAFSGDIRYKNAVLSLSNPEDGITYRNSGVELNRESPRNYVQMLATEGVVSAFLTNLSTGELPRHYLSPSFYRQFLPDSTVLSKPPGELFSPVENQFMKYIHVLHNDVVVNNSSNAQLTDFITGYMRAFPSEAPYVTDLFEKILGVPYSREVPPPMWLLVKEHPHRLLVFDPYDAITVPLYTFDLNAGEIEDFLTLEGFSKADAEKIVQYRQTHGFFTDWKQLETIPGLLPEARQQIHSAVLNEAYLEKELEDFSPGLTLNALIIAPLKHLLSRALLYFAVLFAVIQFLFVKYRTPARQSAVLFTKYLLLWILFVVAGLAAVILEAESAPLYLLGFSAICITLVLFLFRSSPVKRQRSLVYAGSMALLILISVL
jgi:hypothetical protein